MCDIFEIKIGTIIGRMYKIINKIGKGSYGEVFVGKHLRKNELVAIKTERIDMFEKQPFSMLKNEAKMYKYIPNGPGLAQLKWFGRTNTHLCMVTSLLGQSIESYKQCRFSNGMPQELVCNIGRRLMTVIQHIHSAFLIHGDIKPDNILFGNTLHTNHSQVLHYLTDENVVEEIEPARKCLLYIIDFGLSRSYMTDMHTHVLPGTTFKLIGTPTYASINAHNCQKLSRRDDMESIGYVLLHLSTNSLPWSNSKTHSDMLEQKIQFRKTIEAVSLKNQSTLVAYFKMVFMLKYDTTPNYNMI
jgi:serine/threonine protein kinase